MKKLLLTIGLVSAGSLAFGQGTVQFSNGTLYKLSLAPTTGGGTNSGPAVVVPTTAGMEYGLFFGIGQSTSLTLLTSQFGVSSTTGAGIIASPVDGKSALNTVPLSLATAPGETDIWVQMDAWSAAFGTDYAAGRAAFLAGNTAAYWGSSAIVNIPALGPTTGPGVPIWTFSTGTASNAMKAFVILQPIPEPATFALAGLGAAALTIFRRRK